MADEDERGQAGRAPAGLGLGERLRSARKARALSVAQVAETLRLEEPMVLALEEERFEALGAPVFVRGHLRRYAQLVGLAPDSVLEAYRAAVPASMSPPSLARPRVEPEAMRIGAWPLWLLAGALVVGLVIALGSARREPPGTHDGEAAPAAFHGLEPDAAQPGAGSGAAAGADPAPPPGPSPAGATAAGADE